MKTFSDKTKLKDCKIKTKKCMFSDYNGIKLKLNQKYTRNQQQ